MKNKKIWITLLCAFLTICSICAFQVISQNNQTGKDTLSKVEDSAELSENKENEAAAVIPLDSDQVTQTQNNDEQDSSNKKQEAVSENSEEDKKEIVEKNIKSEYENKNDVANETNDSKNVSTFKINTETGLDKYNTEPVPEGKPLPVEWQDSEIDKDKKNTCTLSVSCKTIQNNLDNLNPDKKDIVPEDGVIFAAKEVTFYEGESVFNVLLREMKKSKIHMEFTMTPIYNSNYIEGIANLYEFDCGELSGWMYKVNGWIPNYGCSRYMLKDGDIVEWLYTCDLGRDIGDSFMSGE